MFKRRDWVYTHNPDTGDVTSDSGTDGEADVSDEGTSEAASAGDECDEIDGNSYSDTPDEAVRPMRMEDLQEVLDSDETDDDEDGVIEAHEAGCNAGTSQVDAAQSTDPAAVEKQKALWLQAPEGTTIRGIPLRCLLCKDKLLINSSGFQGHMKSKAHLAAAKRHGVFNDPLGQLDSVVVAALYRHDTEETETHRERVERFRQIAEKVKLRKQSGSTDESSKQSKNGQRKKKQAHDSLLQLEGRVPEQPREATNGSSAARVSTSKSKRKSCGRNRDEKPKRKKPGRRQRMEAKAAVAAAAK